MAISYVGETSGAAINGANVTLDLSTLGLQQGDLVVVAYGIGDNDSLDFNMATVSAGWNEVADLHADDTQDVDLGVYWKLMGSTPDASVEVDGQGGTDAGVAAVAIAFRGIDQATPMDVTPTTATGIDTMHPDPPSINHNNPAGVWIVIAGAAGHALNAGSFTFPTGYTTNALSQLGNDTSDVTVGVGYRSSGVSDPEDPGAMTHSGTDSTGYCWAAATLALRPASSTTYPQSFSESWSASEALSRKLILKQAITETWQASEQLIADAIFTFQQAITETWQAAESLATRLVMKISFSETWQAAEAFVTRFIEGALVAGAGMLRRIFGKQS
jgi:hypothetical protein